MGRVWEARDTLLDRAIAVKEVLLPALPPAQQEMRLQQAGREGRNAAALADHPNIVTVYDVVIEDGVPWIVMQLVRGRSLRALLRDPNGTGVAEDADVELTPLDVDRVAGIAAAMLDALRTMHGAGIVHRDIKPHNILMADDGRVLLTDFGIAKADGDVTVTVSGSVMGTMAYIAPERAEGEAGTSASDFFSLGVTLFEAVEGFSPFERKNSRTGTLTAILTKPLPPMQRAGRLAPLIQALTLKLPEQRPDDEQARVLLSGHVPDTWELPSPDEMGTTVLAPQASGSGPGSAPGSGPVLDPDPAPKPKPKKGSYKVPPPWESAPLTGTTGLPRPPLLDQPKPETTPPVPRKPSNEAVLAGVGVILGLALLIGGIAWYQHSKDQHDQALPPIAPVSATSTTQPYVPPTTDPTVPPVTTEPPAPTTEDTTTTPAPPPCLTESQALDLARTTNGGTLPSDTFVEPQSLQCDSGWGGARLFSDNSAGAINVLYRQDSDGTWSTAFMGTDLCGDAIISQASASIRQDLCPNLG